MPRVFINYRRGDTGGEAGRLHDRLTQRFGVDRVFMDIEALGPGVDFVARIREEIDWSDAVLALIGRSWSTMTTADGRRRLDDPDDYVRLELGEALSRPDTLVIPWVFPASGRRRAAATAPT